MKTHRSLLLLLLTGLCIDGYKPVIIVHGLFDGPKEFATLVSFIKKVGQKNLAGTSIRWMAAVPVLILF